MKWTGAEACKRSASRSKGPVDGLRQSMPKEYGRSAFREVTKACEFIGFGAMDGTKAYEFIGFRAMEVTKAYEFIGFGAMDASLRRGSW